MSRTVCYHKEYLVVI